MSLTSCSECHREISTEAESCPHCGYPRRGTASLKCYACEAPATTRCQCCGALACVSHLESIFVAAGRGGGYELRCRTCYADAENARSLMNLYAIFFTVGALLFLLFCIGIGLSQPPRQSPPVTTVIPWPDGKLILVSLVAPKPARHHGHSVERHQRSDQSAGTACTWPDASTTIVSLFFSMMPSPPGFPDTPEDKKRRFPALTGAARLRATRRHGESRYTKWHPRIIPIIPAMIGSNIDIFSQRFPSAMPVAAPASRQGSSMTIFVLFRG